MKKLFLFVFSILFLASLVSLFSAKTFAATKTITICNANLGSDGKPLVWETRVKLLGSDKRTVISASVIKTNQTSNVASVCSTAKALPSGMRYLNYGTVTLTSTNAYWISWATACADPTYDINTSTLKLDISCHPKSYGSNPTMYAACDRITSANAGGVNGTIPLNQVCPSNKYCATNGWLWSPGSISQEPPTCGGQCVTGCYGSSHTPYTQNASNLNSIYDPYCAKSNTDNLQPSCEMTLNAISQCETSNTNPTSSITFKWTKYNNFPTVSHPIDSAYKYSLTYCDFTALGTNCKLNGTASGIRKISNLSYNTLTYTATGLKPGDTYYWWVTVDNDSNYHYYSPVPFTAKSPYQYLVWGYPQQLVAAADATASTITTKTCACVPTKTCANQGFVCGSFTDDCGNKQTCAPGCSDGKICATDNKTCSCPAGQLFPSNSCNSNICTANPVCGTNQCTTPGANCKATTLSFVVGLDGIGTTGDQKNPAYLPVTGQPLSGSTKQPVHTTRPVNITLVNSSNVSTKFNGSIVYDSTAADTNYGKFKSTNIDLGQTPSGTYKVYVTTAAHLTKLLGSVTITAGQANSVSGVSNLVTGDIVGDTTGTTTANNKLTIEDYNVLISCSIYSKDQTACKLNSNFPALSDLDDNGTTSTPLINEFDYNLFLREFSKTPNGDVPPTASTTTANATTVEVTAQTQIAPSVIQNPIEPSASSGAASTATTSGN